jgi:hypothetical protein
MSIETTEEMLGAFDVTAGILSQSERDSIDKDGYLILSPNSEHWERHGLDLNDVGELLDEMIAAEGWRGGIEGKEETVRPDKPLDPGSDRLANLIDKNPAFRAFIKHPKVLAAVHYIIKAPFKCSAVDMRSPHKGGGEQQLHIDWLPRMEDKEPFDCTIVGFYIDGMTTANGALRVIPGTHTQLDWPNEYIDVLSRHPDEIQAEVPPGSIIVFNSHVWHCGALNESGEIRRTIYVDYRNRNLPQLLNQKRYLRPETISTPSDAERYLLAVRPEDPTDETSCVAPGNAYRARYGNHYLPKELADTADHS